MVRHYCDLARLGQSIPNTAALVGVLDNGGELVTESWEAEACCGTNGEQRLAFVVQSNRPATVAQRAKEIHVSCDRRVSTYTEH